jgi:hypothetical protein
VDYISYITTETGYTFLQTVNSRSYLPLAFDFRQKLNPPMSFPGIETPRGKTELVQHANENGRAFHSLAGLM